MMTSLSIPALRRQFLCMVVAIVLSPVFSVTGSAHGIGAVKPPLAFPSGITVVRSDGLRVPLQSILQGQTTMLQLIYTGCGQTCPLQGALFANVQQRLPALQAKKIQLLSLSIDQWDDAKALSSWLRRFDARPGWIAATVATRKDLGAIKAVLQKGAPAGNNHSSQVYFIDSQSRLIWKSEDLPPVEVINQILEHINN
jgi:protein SCO1/2